MKSVWTLAMALTWLIATGGGTPLHAASPIPPAPQYFVFDEPGLLTAQQREALSSLLIEHDHTSGEQIVFAVFKSLEGQELALRSREIFETWNVGRGVQDNGALLVLFLGEKKARIEVGLGVDPELPAAENQKIIREFLMPELRAGQPYRALGLSALEILRDLQSPLVGTGRAQEILRAGGFQGPFFPVRFGMGTWFVWVLLGAGLFLLALGHLAAAEAHFTSSGWFRPNPWRRLLRIPTRVLRRRPSPLHLGGAHGQW